jgi:hypothetical protein
VGTVTGSGLRIFLYDLGETNASDKWMQWRIGFTLVEIRLGILVEACAHVIPCLSSTPRSGIGGGLELRGGRCNGAALVQGVEGEGRVGLYVSAEDNRSESITVGVR